MLASIAAAVLAGNSSTGVRPITWAESIPVRASVAAFQTT